jgi:hypothetical protein
VVQSGFSEASARQVQYHRAASCSLGLLSKNALRLKAIDAIECDQSMQAMIKIGSQIGSGKRGEKM